MGDSLDTVLNDIRLQNLSLLGKIVAKGIGKAASQHDVCPAPQQDVCPAPQENYSQITANDQLEKCRLCSFSYRGCKLTFTSKSAQENHEKECVKRKYQCEGKTFCGWQCDWIGYYEEIWGHFQEKHRERTNLPPCFFLDTTLRFDRDFTDLQLIKKRNKLFWFKHRVISTEGTGFWLCQYVGPREEACTYGYEFAVADGKRKLHVSELCSSDSEAAEGLFRRGHCVTVPQVRHFVRDKERLKISVEIKKRHEQAKKC